jgi:hypothetical protein
MTYARFLAVAVLAAAAACTDTVPTSPAARPAVGPSLATQGGGSPKFSVQFTSCSSTTTSTSCSFKITGLGNTDVVDIYLTRAGSVDGQCRNHGGQIVEVKDWASSATASDLGVSPDNGQINGSLSISLSNIGSPSVSAVCPNGNWRLTNVVKEFDGDPTLYCVVHHQDGSVEYVYAQI